MRSRMSGNSSSRVCGVLLIASYLSGPAHRQRAPAVLSFDPLEARGMVSDFHEVRFPLDVALGRRGGPGRRTDIVTLGSGREHRNARFAHSRRRYDAGLGVRTLDALHAVLALLEERRGRLYGFRFRDSADWKSCAPGQPVSPLDQPLGTGDGAQTGF